MPWCFFVWILFIKHAENEEEKRTFLMKIAYVLRALYVAQKHLMRQPSSPHHSSVKLCATKSNWNSKRDFRLQIRIERKKSNFPFKLIDLWVRRAQKLNIFLSIFCASKRRRTSRKFTIYRRQKELRSRASFKLNQNQNLISYFCIRNPQFGCIQLASRNVKLNELINSHFRNGRCSIFTIK